jgi:VWFA-related protein
MTNCSVGFRRTGLLLLLLVPLCPAETQDKKPGQKETKTEQSPFAFKVPVDVIVVNATVTDAKGKPVLDLTADDFKIFEDGKPQSIHTFTLETYKAVQPPAMSDTKSPPAIARDADLNYSQSRMFALVIDDVTSAREYLYATVEAAKKFVEQDLGPADQVAIVAASGRVQHPFTDDKQLLLAELGTFHEKADMSPVSRSTCPMLTDLQAQRIANDMNDGISMEVAVEETIVCAHLENDPSAAPGIARSAAMSQFQETAYRNRGLLRNLRQYIRSLRHFDARKNLILFSDGFLFQEVIYELQDVVDQALRAGVVLNTVDIRGLYVSTFSASDNVTPVSAASRIPISPQFVGQKLNLLNADMMSQEEPLTQLAHDTGGIFYHNSNDLHAGLKAVSDREAHSYVLTYASPAQKADGRYHKIKLEVSRPGLQLSYRKGYYAPKEQTSFERRRKEDILEALNAPGNVNEIPVGFSYNSYQVDDSRYEVELLTRVDVRRMTFVEEESRRKNLISLVVVAFDESDRYVDGLQKDVSFNLSDSSYAELLSRGFASKVTIRVPPGRYKIRTVVRESVQGKMGSLSKGVEVP